MKSFQNAAIVKVTSDRDDFTQYGLCLNRKGKEQAAKTIAKSVRELFKVHKNGPIKMSLREEQRLEVANTVSSNVDNNGGQLIHIEQTSRDQEQKEEAKEKLVNGDKKEPILKEVR
jgi:hypothetical protein